MANKSNNSTDLIASGFNSTDLTTTGFDEFVGDEDIDLLQYWRAIYRYRWAILALVFVVGLFTTVYAYSLQPLYRSTATLLIGGDEAVTESDTQSWVNSGNYLNTQYELIWSRKVAKRVLETQREVILAHMETDSESGFDWHDWVPRSWLGQAEPDQPCDVRRRRRTQGQRRQHHVLYRPPAADRQPLQHAGEQR